MADYASVRQRIISSVFSKLSASGHQETYVAHVKIWEDVSPEEGGKKPRYIIIASMYGLHVKLWFWTCNNASVFRVLGRYWEHPQVQAQFQWVLLCR